MYGEQMVAHDMTKPCLYASGVAQGILQLGRCGRLFNLGCRVGVRGTVSLDPALVVCVLCRHRQNVTFRLPTVRPQAQEIIAHADAASLVHWTKLNGE